MQHISLGRSGLSVSPLVFGANVFGWTLSEAESFNMLDALVDHGINFIDTADVYSAWFPGNQGGESETIIGKWIQRGGRRDDLVIATKVGMWTQRPGLSAANIATAVEDSLRRLQTDRIDVYFSHIDDTNTPFEETLGAYAKLIAAGKVRAIGASNHSPDRLREVSALAASSGLPRYDVLQPHYNLYERAVYEEALEPLALELGIGVVCYYALASGFLTGKYRSLADLAGRPRGQRIEAYMNDRGFAILRALDEIASRHTTTPATVALAWLMARPSITAPIASATSISQLQALVDATSLRLSPDDVALLDTASHWQA